MFVSEWNHYEVLREQRLDAIRRLERERRLPRVRRWPRLSQALLTALAPALVAIAAMAGNWA